MKHPSIANRAVPRSGSGLLAMLLWTAGLAACGGGGNAAGSAAGPPAVPVEAIVLAEHPVEQTTDYVGTVKSRRSTNVKPQVEGFVTRILVQSGDRVQPGAALMQIDPSMQQAAVSNLESVRAAREADLLYAQQDASRLRKLFDAGASSRSELEQAQTALSNADAQLKAIEAQIRQQKVSLAYYGVTAPTAGVVGDIPVRVGDSVTRSTVLTTIDQNAGLEVYISVPVQQAAASEGRPSRPPPRRPRASRPRPRRSPSWRPPSTRRPSRCWPRRAWRSPAPSGPSSSSAAGSAGRDAGADRPPRGRQPHQRPVLRLRGRERGGRKGRGPPAGDRDRRRGRKRLRRQVGAQSRGEADRRRGAEDR